MKYISRSIEQTFLEKSKEHKVVLVVGAEEIGKMTMMKHLSEGERRSIVSLSDLHPRTLAESDPDMFFEMFKPPVMIDGIHFVPSILYKMKEICEQSDEMGQFWLTCPPESTFIEKVKKIMGDRVAVLKMYGLSLKEKNGVFPKKNLIDTYRQIWWGGMPAANDIPQEEKAKYFWHYFNENLMGQIVESKKIKLPTEFSDFLSACAVNISQVLSVQRLAKIAGISSPTATIWLQLLIDLGVIYLLKSYESDEFTRLITKPKLYFTDTGLCSYISNWKTPQELMNGGESDAYFKNFVVMELVKSFANRTDGLELRYFRNGNGRQIDLVIVKGRELYPFEIRKAAAPGKETMRDFVILDGKSVIRGSGGIICTCRELEKISERDYLLPYHIF